jgi:hypothetical protein
MHSSGRKHSVNSLIPFIRGMYILSEDCSQFLDNTRFQRVLVVAARTVDAVASAGTAAAPFFALMLVEYVTAESASHARIPVSRSILFKT